jgi:hypothetical protein
VGSAFEAAKQGVFARAAYLEKPSCKSMWDKLLWRAANGVRNAGKPAKQGVFARRKSEKDSAFLGSVKSECVGTICSLKRRFSTCKNGGVEIPARTGPPRFEPGKQACFEGAGVDLSLENKAIL